MTTNLEYFEQKRSHIRRNFLIWSTVFFVTWFVRSALKLAEVENDLIYTVLLIVLLVSLGFQVVFMLKDHSLDTEMKKHPQIREAMDDELVLLNELRAWKIAFFVLVGFILFAAVLSIVMRINDPMLIYITALLVGFGSRNMAVYTLNR